MKPKYAHVRARIALADGSTMTKQDEAHIKLVIEEAIGGAIARLNVPGYQLIVVINEEEKLS